MQINDIRGERSVLKEEAPVKKEIYRPNPTIATGVMGCRRNSKLYLHDMLRENKTADGPRESWSRLLRT